MTVPEAGAGPLRLREAPQVVHEQVAVPGARARQLDQLTGMGWSGRLLDPVSPGDE